MLTHAHARTARRARETGRGRRGFKNWSVRIRPIPSSQQRLTIFPSVSFSRSHSSLLTLSLFPPPSSRILLSLSPSSRTLSPSPSSQPADLNSFLFVPSPLSLHLSSTLLISLPPLYPLLLTNPFLSLPPHQPPIKFLLRSPNPSCPVPTRPIHTPPQHHALRKAPRLAAKGITWYGASRTRASRASRSSSMLSPLGVCRPGFST